MPARERSGPSPLLDAPSWKAAPAAVCAPARPAEAFRARAEETSLPRGARSMRRRLPIQRRRAFLGRKALPPQAEGLTSRHASHARL